MFTTRRSFIASAAASLGMSVFHETLAQSASTIVGVSWGGAQVDGAKAIAAEWLKGRRDYRMAWEVHEGSSSAVATKIRSTWPDTPGLSRGPPAAPAPSNRPFCEAFRAICTQSRSCF